VAGGAGNAAFPILVRSAPLAVLVPMRLTPGRPQLRRSPHNHHTDTRRPT